MNTVPSTYTRIARIIGPLPLVYSSLIPMQTLLTRVPYGED